MALGAAGVAQNLNVLLGVAEGLRPAKARHTDSKRQEATLLSETVRAVPCRLLWAERPSMPKSEKQRKRDSSSQPPLSPQSQGQ